MSERDAAVNPQGQPPGPWQRRRNPQAQQDRQLGKEGRDANFIDARNANEQTDACPEQGQEAAGQFMQEDKSSVAHVEIRRWL